jgi:hypothetical protein
MGLLDEAIRDHLELKRRRGADPSEIARAEHEALEPVFPAQEASERDTEPAEEEPEPTGSLDGGPVVADGLAWEAPAPDGTAVAQDTAEIDMQAVLDAQDGEIAISIDDGAFDDALLEWETPDRAAIEPAGPLTEEKVDELSSPAGASPGVVRTGKAVDPPISGQERISFE